jgi:hypothetical protein
MESVKQLVKGARFNLTLRVPFECRQRFFPAQHQKLDVMKHVAQLVRGLQMRTKKEEASKIDTSTQSTISFHYRRNHGRCETACTTLRA